MLATNLGANYVSSRTAWNHVRTVAALAVAASFTIAPAGEGDGAERLMRSEGWKK
jgi:hypothetical protein